MSARAPKSRVRIPDPCALVIFGASGDLTARKLFPALYDLKVAKLLPDNFAVIGFSRTEMTDDQFRESMHDALAARGQPVDETVWSAFAPSIHYIPAGDHDEAAYRSLHNELQELDSKHETNGNRLYYLATPPSAYFEILDLMNLSGLAKGAGGWTRIVVEKPFGHDVDSARELDERLHQCFTEPQVYRIDHYLGKETVQNLFVLRFANGIAEPVWNRRYIDNVQITVAETLGVEHRARYYEEAGAIRDMMANHLLQLLTLTAMEPPVDFEQDAIRDEKVKVLRALEHGGVDIVRGQYRSGYVEGQKEPGYRDEEGVAPDSSTETYVAARCFVENWRWAGVPFYLRTGKRLPVRATEITVEFKQAPFLPFVSTAVDSLEPNRYVIKIQPQEGASLYVNAKVPGPGPMRIRNVEMRFDYGEEFKQAETPDAYLRLLLDAMLGDATLFTRSDEVVRQWEFVQPMLDDGRDPEPYAAGTWGPAAADRLLARDGRTWHDPA
jgi:glucose-6-phosphate 1-dehydrogenase